jgi:hypothetical protein
MFWSAIVSQLAWAILDEYLTAPTRRWCGRPGRSGERERLQLYFGATSGEVFRTGDAGASWSTVTTRLVAVFSVAAWDASYAMSDADITGV